MRRHPQLAMTNYDLAEFHRYLLLFTKIYEDCEQDIKRVSLAVQDIFFEQSHLTDTEAMEKLRNPRHAGRKNSLNAEQISEIRAMRKDGLSIRKISEQMKVPKSTVQRVLSSQ